MCIMWLIFRFPALESRDGSAHLRTRSAVRFRSRMRIGPVGEASRVADVGEDAGSADGADAGQVHYLRAGGEHHRLELLVEGLDLLVERKEVVQFLEREPLAGLPARSRGRLDASIALA